jgi:pyrrolysine biosynthesis protein PylD
VTRLKTDDIISIAASMADYDAELAAKTGFTLRGIASRAAGIREDEIQSMLDNVLVGAIPISSGEGIIGGFCDAVKAIVSHLGCRAFITQAADVAGLVEAFENNADIMMLSDDNRFVALHAKSSRIIDNAIATGEGFVTGLNLMADGLKGRDVLVIGCGPVGSSAIESLVRMGARVSVYDINQHRCNDVAESIAQRLNSRIRSLSDLDTALVDARLILDATPAANIIRAHHITPETYISAPGVPLGLDVEARSKISDRILHDPLQIGVATMLACALRFYNHDCRYKSQKTGQTLLSQTGRAVPTH